VSKGYFVWNDLMTSDLAAVLPFYQGLLGWTTDTSDMGTGPYTMFKAGDKHIGGVTPGHQGQPYWVSYISVDDVDAACKQIESLGGRIMGASPLHAVVPKLPRCAAEQQRIDLEL